MRAYRLSDLHADIFSPAGAALGTVNNIRSWEYTSVLDGAGDWSLECRGYEANGTLLVEGRRADIYGTIDTTETLLCSGRVDIIEPDFNRGALCYYVEGQDRIGDLGDRIITTAYILEQDWTYIGSNGAVRWIDSTGISAERNLVQAYDGTPATYTDPTFKLGDHWWLYIGYMMPFVAAKFTFESTNGELEGDNEQYQYYSNNTGWTALPGLVDGTKVDTNILAQDGTMTWTRPGDWARSTPTASSGSWYWMRIRTDADESGSTVGDISLKEIEIYADKPTANGLNIIMAYAPDGWKKSGYANTAGSAYGVISDYSVLQALDWLRQQIGGHFRWSVVGGTAQVDWQTTFSDSLYTADGGGVA